MIYTLEREQFIAGDPEQIWTFFASPHNLNVLTPDEVRFRILSEVTTPMYEGQMIEYRISMLPGLWSRWLTEITHVREGTYFVDEQRIGPYVVWHHEHFYEVKAGGVLMRDKVTYDPGWSWLGQVVHRVWIRGKLDSIFDYRAAKIRQLFPGSS